MLYCQSRLKSAFSKILKSRRNAVLECGWNSPLSHQLDQVCSHLRGWGGDENTGLKVETNNKQTWLRYTANNSTGDCYSSKTCQLANNLCINRWLKDGQNSHRAWFELLLDYYLLWTWPWATPLVHEFQGRTPIHLSLVYIGLVMEWATAV